MTTFSIVSIIMFSLAGILFVTAVVVFITTDVLTSIKYLSNKGQVDSDSKLSSPSIIADRQVVHKSVVINSPVIQSNSVEGIEYAQQTIDTDELDGLPDPSFETQDWDLPDGGSFVLTKNIVVCHSDKEYMIREA